MSGSRPKAEDGTLTIMAGGPEAAFARAAPLFDVLGERIVHVGPQGHGQLAKLLTNVMGAVNAAALAESVVTVRAAGIDPDAFLQVAEGSAGNSAMVTLKGPPMFEERFGSGRWPRPSMREPPRKATARRTSQRCSEPSTKGLGLAFEQRVNVAFVTKFPLRMRV